MRRIVLVVSALTLSLVATQANAATSFRGDYTCSMDSSSTIRDPSGNSIAIPDFPVTVNRSGRVSVKTKMTFRISGKSQRLSVEGTGRITETYPNSEATFAFTLKPSRTITYKNKPITLKAKNLSIYKSGGSAYGGGLLVTPFGESNITCGSD